jgi:hypothetical protein
LACCSKLFRDIYARIRRQRFLVRSILRRSASGSKRVLIWGRYASRDGAAHPASGTCVASCLSSIRRSIDWNCSGASNERSLAREGRAQQASNRAKTFADKPSTRLASHTSIGSVPRGIWPNSNGNHATRPQSSISNPVFVRAAIKDSLKNEYADPKSFVFCQKLLGYFCDKDLRKCCWWFCPRWLQSGSPGAVCTSGFAHGTSAGRTRNLGAVRTGTALFCQRRQFHARYAIRATPHKHWRLRISLIWQVGT